MFLQNLIDDPNPPEGHQIVCLHGPGGTGKTIMMEKVASYVESKNQINLNAASTNLASQNFANCRTGHSLFKYPVLEDRDEVDANNKLDCVPSEERLELLNNARVIQWDEIFNVDVDFFEAVIRELQYNTRLILILYGDGRQNPPVVENASAFETISASVKSSYLWPTVNVRFLETNMRLNQFLMKDNLTAEDRIFIAGQLKYRAILESTGENKKSDGVTILDEVVTAYEIKQKLALDNVNFYENTEEGIDNAIQWLYPNGYPEYPSSDTEHPSRMILALTNKEIDNWNNKIQALNPEVEKVHESNDVFSDIDDDNGYLAAALSTRVRRNFTHSQVPNHELTLKVNDICMITRNLMSIKLASNCLVRILRMNKYSIVIVTMDKKKRTLILPRIRFKFKLRYTSSFSLTRTQFPLRLAYAVTINRIQGQSVDYIVLDLSKDPFCHGQTYTALSRIRIYNRIKLIVRENEFMTNAIDPTPIISNTIYPSLLVFPSDQTDTSDTNDM